MYLFVYGSLKKGFHNHERFGFDKIPFLGEHELAGYNLWDLGDYPGMTGNIIGTLNPTVKGEVYDVPDGGKMFAILRMMEEGAGFFLVPINLFIPIDGVKKKQISTFVYEGGLGGATIIPSGEWKDGKS